MTDDPLLTRFLAAHLGAWPPPKGSVEVVGSPRREVPAWDGRVQSLVAVVSPDGGVLSVPPAQVEAVREAVGGRAPAELAAAYREVARAVAPGRSRVMEGVFRWSSSPVAMPDAGQWLPVSDPVVPEWLHPFGGEVLVALEDGRYLAGVGLKRHDQGGEEIAVGTDERARGRGLARRLVAQATRAVLSQGAVVTYIHAADNHASSKVAAACGFPDLGWRALALAGEG